MVSLLMSTILITLPLNTDTWRSINDGVMGGVSVGQIVKTAEGLRFEGLLSLENNGGFASVRRPVNEDLANAAGVQLQVRGDGRSYQFRIRQESGFDGIAWSAEFTTSDDWQTVNLPFKMFVPVFRGQQVPDAGPVLPGAIEQIGFMLADKTPGSFALEFRLLGFYRAPG
jgi:monofunctional biosynthetic peptidoglycan transglycosylase